MSLENHYGELAALATACFWTVTALSFEFASKRVGSLAVNMIRLTLAFLLLGTFTLITRGMFLPLDATPHAWIWLSLSGLVGLVLGDYFLFKAYAVITSRIAMLIMTTVPPITALIGWLLLGEKMLPLHLAGMALTMTGILMAIFTRPENGQKLKLSYPVKGIIFALIASVGQAGGLVLSKYGMGEYNSFAASHIRLIAGMSGYALIILILGKQSLIKNAVRDAKGMRAIALGSFFGPFLGISFSLLAVKYTETGIAATIMAIVPILIIIPSVFIFKEKFTWLEIIGAFISFAGVVVMFL
jgi:drug/metabolite transporter (DMT)-like permease